MSSPSGRLVAIVGPDGAGKSTLLPGIASNLRPYFGDVHEFHWRPSLFPDIGVLLQRKIRDSRGPVESPHAQSLHSIPVSLLRLIYYWLDFWVGYFFKIRRLLAKNHLVIFDRFAIDMWLDPKRFRLNIPSWLLRTLVRWTPQPNLYLFLSAPATVLYQRKPETSPSAVQTALDLQEESAKALHDRSVKIDVSMSPADSLKASLKAIKKILGTQK